MNLKAFSRLILVLALVNIPLISEAATAIATVTANIVPRISFAASGSAVFSGLAKNHDVNRTVQLNSSGSDSPAKLRIQSGRKHAYSISVAMPSDLNDEFNTALNIVDSQLTVNKGGLTEKGEREFNFGGAIEIVNIPNNESLSGYVYITTNFN